MKFLKFLMMAVFAIVSMSASAQIESFYPSIKVAPVIGLGGENSGVDMTVNYGVQVSVGGRNEYNFIGVGFGVEGFTECDEIWGNSTGLNIPLYAQYTYSHPSGYTADMKIGPSFYTYDHYTKTGFYMSISPFGFNLDRHNSFAVSYRYMRLYDVNCNGIQFSYTYTF